MMDSRRQAKLKAAREFYEQMMQQHPQLQQIELGLVELYRSKVFKTSDFSLPLWERQVGELGAKRKAYLQEHKIPADFAEPKWDCPLCQDTGILEGTLCACERQRLLENRFKGAHLPLRLQEQTFDKFSLQWYSAAKKTPLGNSEREQAAVVLQAGRAFVAAVIENPGRASGLFLTGQTGLGKTFLCSAICHALADNNIIPLYTVFSDLISDMRASFQYDSGDSGLLAMAREAPVLILDDLGAEHVTDYSVSRLFDIINHRHNRRLPTVISSNLSLSDISQVYSMRIASRITESCKPAALFGTDIRAQQRKLGLKSS